MNQYVLNIIDALDQLSEDNQQLQRLSALTAELSWASASDVDYLLGELVSRLADERWETTSTGLEPILARLTQSTQQHAPVALDSGRLVLISQLYDSPSTDERARCYLLGWLASHQTDDAIKAFADFITRQPPKSSSGIVLAFAPLLEQASSLPVDSLFPKLLEAIQYPHTATAVLDIANFVMRNGKCGGVHPAAVRKTELMKMLEGLTAKLERIESGELPDGMKPAQLGQIVNEGVSLMASLCDALALIGDQRAIPSLRHAAELRHRRIRTEACAALASLGDENGQDELLQMASEPIARARVISYARELGMQDRIDSTFCSPLAIAESHLAMWLAQPAQMGFAPTNLNSIDDRMLFWPGYEDPVQCFLFKYTYSLSGNQLENIGIAGPLIHAFTSSLVEFSIPDIYACFAGWHCEHDEIHECSIEYAQQTRPGLVEKLISRVDANEIKELSPAFVGFFMSEPVLVCSGKSGDRSGSLIIDESNAMWICQDQTDLHAREEMAYCIYKGRRLLGTFNPPEYWPGNESA